MGDTLLAADSAADENLARKLADMLAEHKGRDPVVIDLRGLNAWTDFFVVAGAASATHLHGLERQVKDFCAEHGVEILRKSGKRAAIDESWKLIDLGAVVVHIMTEEARSFYELERLWSQAPIYRLLEA